MRCHVTHHQRATTLHVGDQRWHDELHALTHIDRTNANEYGVVVRDQLIRAEQLFVANLNHRAAECAEKLRRVLTGSNNVGDTLRCDSNWFSHNAYACWLRVLKCGQVLVLHGDHRAVVHHVVDDKSACKLNRAAHRCCNRYECVGVRTDTDRWYRGKHLVAVTEHEARVRDCTVCAHAKRNRCAAVWCQYDACNRLNADWWHHAKLFDDVALERVELLKAKRNSCVNCVGTEGKGESNRERWRSNGLAE